MINRIWNAIVNWFERGDLIPLLVLVSAVHYANILAAYDWWGVAVAIGLLVDLGHYRIIREAMTYTGTSRKGIIIRWTFAATMTGMSLAYHQMFYNNFWLSAPLPLLIAALAWLQRVDRAKPSESVAKPSKVAANESKTEQTFCKPSASDFAEVSNESKLVCCDCGYAAKNQLALNAHKRVHKEVTNEPTTI